MELVKVDFDAPKELNDVRLALVKVVSLLAAGNNPFGAVISALHELNVALEGIKNVPAEVKEALGKSVALVGLMGGEIIDAIKKA